VVVADERRSRGCAIAVEEFDVDCILLDDAYQHRAMHRDIDIVVIDAIEGIYTQRMLPVGRLREPLEHLRRADVILLSKCEASTPVEQMRQALAAYSQVPVYATRFVPRSLRRLEDAADLPLDALAGVPVGAFCGIGMPEGFRHTLRRMGIKVATERSFPDHHWYGASDIEALRRSPGAADIRVWITTEKDAMRLAEGQEWKRLGDVYYPRMEVEFLAEEDGFDALMSRRMHWPRLSPDSRSQ
jgi:tetraacyldisaccharide 4'-kinase